MLVNGKNCQSLRYLPENDEIEVIDQRKLPFELSFLRLKTIEEVYQSIKNMTVRGAPLIGACAAFGMYFAVLSSKKSSSFDLDIKKSAIYLKSCRPTAVNLAYCVDKVLQAIENENNTNKKIIAALDVSISITDNEIKNCIKIGEHGFPLIAEISDKKNGETVNILTHCNAGWLACIDYGTALSPIYLAHNKGIKVHVWIDETRPLNQGSRLTAWELANHGISHTIVTDNTGGHLMQNGKIDIVIVGSDRTTLNGDVANKIGTYLKALAAFDNNVPFYVALPSSTFDLSQVENFRQLPIELRNESEIKFIEGKLGDQIVKIQIVGNDSHAANYAFDITPSRLVTGLITERGICKPNKMSILELFPEFNFFE